MWAINFVFSIYFRQIFIFENLPCSALKGIMGVYLGSEYRLLQSIYLIKSRELFGIFPTCNISGLLEPAIKTDVVDNYGTNQPNLFFLLNFI